MISGSVFSEKFISITKKNNRFQNEIVFHAHGQVPVLLGQILKKGHPTERIHTEMILRNTVSGQLL
jgi:hypothetical protein